MDKTQNNALQTLINLIRNCKISPAFLYICNINPTGTRTAAGSNINI